jgi:hypothetical protein
MGSNLGGEGARIFKKIKINKFVLKQDMCKQVWSSLKNLGYLAS